MINAWHLLWILPLATVFGMFIMSCAVAATLQENHEAFLQKFSGDKE